MAEQIVDVVEIHWYTRGDGLGPAAADAWLRLSRRYLPEALPRRFGPVEPLRTKLDAHETEAFVQAVAEDSVYFAATKPCFGGHLGREQPGVWSHHLAVFREPLHDPRWAGALRRLFVEFAVATGAVFACAEVEQGLRWTGRQLYGLPVDQTVSPAARGTWAGLPPHPAWWTWFGPDYAPLVLDQLPDHGHLQGCGDAGILHTWADEPLDRPQLTTLLGLDRTWLPADLLATPVHRFPRSHNPSLVPAATIPPSLEPASLGEPE